MRCFVRGGRRNIYLDFCARSRLAPKVQLRSDTPGTLTNAWQTPVARAVTLTQKLRLYALSVVADTQAKKLIVVSNLGFYVTRASVLESITQNLAGNPVDFLLQDLS